MRVLLQLRCRLDHLQLKILVVLFLSVMSFVRVIIFSLFFEREWDLTDKFYFPPKLQIQLNDYKIHPHQSTDILNYQQLPSKYLIWQISAMDLSFMYKVHNFY
jgi:hypothetical protein